MSWEDKDTDKGLPIKIFHMGLLSLKVNYMSRVSLILMISFNDSSSSSTRKYSHETNSGWEWPSNPHNHVAMTDEKIKRQVHWEAGVSISL